MGQRALRTKQQPDACVGCRDNQGVDERCILCSHEVVCKETCNAQSRPIVSAVLVFQRPACAHSSRASNQK